jgi:hypothetical protein
MTTWISYILLAVATNTALGPPFDPVLLFYAAGRPPTQAWGFILVGCLCAGAAGALEASLGRRFLARRADPPSVSRSWKGRSLYLFAAAVAASPFPFTLVRLAALGRGPAPSCTGPASRRDACRATPSRPWLGTASASPEGPWWSWSRAGWSCSSSA